LNSVSVFYYLCGDRSHLRPITATALEHKGIYVKNAIKKIHGEDIAIIIKINIVEFVVNEVRSGSRKKSNSTDW
jgi:hypothetical protein